MFDPYRKWLGIPENSRPPTHYQLLAITPTEKDPDVIHAAVMQRSAYVRNFQTGKYVEDATRILNEIAAAKVCLLDSAKRAAYDAELKKKQPPPVPRPTAAAAPALTSPLADPLFLQPAGPAMSAPWLSPMAARPAPRRSVPIWQLAAAVGGTVVVVLLIVAFVLSGGDEERLAETEEAPAAAAPSGPAEPPESTGATPESDPAASASADANTSPGPEAVAPVSPTDVSLTQLRPFDIMVLVPPAGELLTDAGDGPQRLFSSEWSGSKASEHIVWMHPPRPGTISAHVAFDLGGIYGRFRGAVGLSDMLSAPGSAVPLTFRIVGDGRPIWSSTAIQDRGATQDFDVDVAGVQRLDLLVDCPGANDAAWAHWIGPQLTGLAGGGAARLPPAPDQEPEGVSLKDLQPLEIHTIDPFTAEPIPDDADGAGRIFNRAWAGGLPADQVIWMHPPPGGAPAHVAFRLGGDYQWLRGAAAISDAQTRSATPLVFRIIGDGRQVWKSRPLQDRGATDPFDVDVTGVDKLELLVDCAGPIDGAWALWLDPRVGPRASAP